MLLREILVYLDQIGWSELVDEKWKDDIEYDIL